MVKNFGQFINESKNNSVNEAKMPTVSKELMKATEKMHAEQLKQQELQKKFVSETDATKKEKMKADLIAQHKKVKEAERNFQEALGREHVDYDDELLETNRLNEKKAYVELDTFDFDDADFQKFLKKNNIKAKQVAAGGPYDNTPIYVYTASDKDTLKKMLDQFWLTDAGSQEDKEEWYGLIESSLNEGAITKAIRPALEGEVKAAVEALEKELQSTGAILDYKHADELAYLIIDIIDAAKQEERVEISQSESVVNENGSIKLSSKDKQLIKRFQNWAVDNPTSTDVDFFSAKHKLNSEQRYLLKKVFLSGDFQITAAGPLPSDIKPRIG